MVAPISTSRYHFPAGYAQPRTKYGPSFNGYAGSPAISHLGPTQDIAVVSVPADLSLLTLVSPSGVSYTFQFVYNASVQNAGIKIPLPNSGASTAAQVSSAITTVLAALSGTPFGSSTPTIFPWAAAQTAAAVTSLSWKIGGTAGAPTLPAGITNTSFAESFSSNAVVPGVVGPIRCFLPGN